jgi:hypothetical protein
MAARTCTMLQAPCGVVEGQYHDCPLCSTFSRPWTTLSKSSICACFSLGSCRVMLKALCFLAWGEPLNVAQPPRHLSEICRGSRVRMALTVCPHVHGPPFCRQASTQCLCRSLLLIDHPAS